MAAMEAARPWLCLLLCSLLFFWGSSEATNLAELPPRGWNSYDSFSWTIDEAAFLHNAEILAEKLLPHGYEYAVIDFLWYRRNVEGAWLNSYGFDNIDEWGRPFPDPQRFPSSAGGKGFSPIAKKVHDMGLKFGIHLMKGISTQAVNASTPILDIKTGKPYVEDGRQWTAHDIGLTHTTCPWMSNGFMSVNTDLGAGWAFLRSLYQQYADWGADFVKVDCIFGTDFRPKEIISISEILCELDRPVVLSLSPGAEATPALAEGISEYVNLYRITGDDWDSWKDVSSHFDTSSSFAAANKIGAKGLRGQSWPDLDMLPFGWLTDASSNQGPRRRCNLTADEQKTQMALWSIARSPIMYGGDLRHLDRFTFSLITNPTLLEINDYSKNNMEFHDVYSEGTSVHAILSKSQCHVNLTESGDIVLGLTACSDGKAKGWYNVLQHGKSDQICRNYGAESDKNISFCLSKTKPLLTSDEVTMDNNEYQTKFHLASTDTVDACLDASGSQRLTASEIQTIMFSKCKQHAKQMWELLENGSLVSSYSRLCAKMQLSTKGAEGITGVRAWMATGRKGEVYLAFFNLNSTSTRITARISDLAKVLGREFFRKGSCGCTEVWSGKRLGPVKEKISAVVNSHGSLVFVLNC